VSPLFIWSSAKGRPTNKGDVSSCDGQHVHVISARMRSIPFTFSAQWVLGTLISHQLACGNSCPNLVVLSLSRLLSLPLGTRNERLKTERAGWLHLAFLSSLSPNTTTSVHDKISHTATGLRCLGASTLAGRHCMELLELLVFFILPSRGRNHSKWRAWRSRTPPLPLLEDNNEKACSVFYDRDIYLKLENQSTPDPA